MGVFQAFGGLADVIGDGVEIHRAVVVDDRLQIAPFDVLHHQVMDVAFVIDVVRADDIFVIQPGGGLGLALESGEIRRIVHAALRQHLDRHTMVHAGMLGQIDAAHAAGAEQAQQLVAAEKEAFMTAFEQLGALPSGNELGLDERVGQR